MNTINKSFLGTGWSFPPEFNTTAGVVLLRENEEDIAESLKIILTTIPGERILRPGFGCNLRDYLFEPLDVTLKTHLRDLIERALILHEPRIDVNNVLLQESVNPLEGQTLIEVDYTIRGTNTRYNLVFPFYLEEASDDQSLILD